MTDESDPALTSRLKDLILAVDRDRIQKIILFGSRARGDARPDSDYDLLVVFRDLKPGERHAVLVALYGAVAGAGVVVEPFVMGEEEFEETKGVIGGLAYPASKEGVGSTRTPDQVRWDTMRWVTLEAAGADTRGMP